MSKNQEATAKLIAQDVMRQLATDRIRGGFLSYVNWMDDDVYVPDIDLLEEGDLKGAFADAERCSVCAKGALLLSLLERYGQKSSMSDEDLEYSVSDGELSTKIVHEELYNHFSPESLMQLEAAFERWDVCKQKNQAASSEIHQGNQEALSKTLVHNYSLVEPRLCEVEDDHVYSKRATIHLAHIMNHLIEHKGKFVPEEFIDDILTNGYDENILDPWIEKEKKLIKNEEIKKMC